MKFIPSLAIILFLAVVSCGCQSTGKTASPGPDLASEVSDDWMIGRRAAMVRGQSPYEVHLQPYYRFSHAIPNSLGASETKGTWTRRGKQLILIGDLQGEERSYSVWNIIWHEGKVCLVQQIEGQFVDKDARHGHMAKIQALPGQFVDQVLRR